MLMTIIKWIIIILAALGVRTCLVEVKKPYGTILAILIIAIVVFIAKKFYLV